MASDERSERNESGVEPDLEVLVEIARMASIHAGALVWARVWLQMQTFLRANMLAAQVASGGPEAGQPAEDTRIGWPG